MYAAALTTPDKEAQALGEKRYQALLDSVARMMAKEADNDNQAPAAPQEQANNRTPGESG